MVMNINNFHGDPIMSFYRSLLAAVAALVVALPAFADETPAATTDQTAQPAAQSTETQATAQPAAEQSKVNINKATVKELTKVKGISPAKAKAIVSYRKKNGDFKSVDDLKNVKGFKKMNEEQMKNIQDQLTAG
jgi:comEA protein